MFACARANWMQIKSNFINYHLVFTRIAREQTGPFSAAFITNRLNMRRTNKQRENLARWHVHVETQVLLIMKMIFTCLTLNAVFCSIGAHFFSLGASYDGTGSIHDCTAMIHREDYRLLFHSRAQRVFSALSRGHGAMTTRIRGGGQKQSQFEPFFASRHRSEINLKLPSCTHSLTPF